MALALIWPEEANDDPKTLRLRFDIGRNRYYAWQLGSAGRVRSHGIERIAEVAHRSPLSGPLAPSAFGRGVLEIPRALLSKENRFAQLTSFRGPDGVGPAISPIVELDRTAATRTMNGGDAMTMAATRSFSAALALPVDAAPLRWRERDLSQGMFLQGLLAALPSLLPNLAPMIGSVLTSTAPAVGQIVGNLVPGLPGLGGTAPGGASSPIAQLIEQLLRGLGQSAKETLTPDTINKIVAAVGGGAAPEAKPAAKALAFGSLGQRLARSAPRGYSASLAADRRRRRGAAQPMSQGQQYSQAMVAPALLAALPALMPLLQQVMSPQNIQTLVDAPQRATGQIINGILDFAKLGMQATEAEREHLRKLNPGVDNPALDQLLMSMSQGLSAARRLNYRRVPSVRLSFDAAQSLVLFGRSRVLYRHGQALQFPLSVNTPQAIPAARLLLQIKHPDTLAVLAESAEDLGELASGPLPLVPRFDETELARLEPNQDFVVCATLTWKNRKRQAVGTSMQQRIALVGEYSFDRVEESGEPIAASDFERYRDLWHKIWQGDFGAGTHSARLDCRYYLVLNPKRTNNARLDTHLESAPEGGAGSKLRAGMEVSPYALNHLLARLAPGTPALDDAQMQALAGSDFVERFNQAAQFSARFRGRRGQHAALWIYPEFKLQTLVLTRADDVDENGNVRSLGETRLRFPMPVLLHFVGLESASQGFAAGNDDAARIEGMEVVFDEKVSLFPVELEELRQAPQRAATRPRQRALAMH